MSHTLTPIMRRAIAALVIFVAFGASAQVERGQKSFGPKIGFASRNTSALAGLTFDYAFSSHVRIAPSIGLIFRHNDRDAFLFDIDMHFPIATWKTSTIYPLAGITYQSWGRHDIDPSTQKDVTTHQNSLGLNAGAGWELRLTRTLKIGIEAKYALIRHNPNAQVAAKIAYVF